MKAVSKMLSEEGHLSDAARFIFIAKHNMDASSFQSFQQGCFVVLYQLHAA